MLEALFAAAAEAVFTYILDTLDPAERLRDWLKRNPVKLANQLIRARTYAAHTMVHVLGVPGSSAAGDSADLRDRIIVARVEELQHPNSQREVQRWSQESDVRKSKGKLEDAPYVALLQVAGWLA